jgi:hypothetical protein
MSLEQMMLAHDHLQACDDETAWTLRVILNWTFAAMAQKLLTDTHYA